MLSKRIKFLNTPQAGSSCQSSSCSKSPLVLKLFPSCMQKTLPFSLKGSSIYWGLPQCSRYFTEVIAFTRCLHKPTGPEPERKWTRSKASQECYWNRRSSLKKREEEAGQDWNLKRKCLNFVEFRYEWIVLNWFIQICGMRDHDH